jgi:hypothetical protein
MNASVIHPTACEYAKITRANMMKAANIMEVISKLQQWRH